MNGDWQQMHGDARDIGIGADGSIWVAAGGGIFRWNGVSWDRTSGSAVRIDVDPYGTPWVIDHTDDIYDLLTECGSSAPATRGISELEQTARSGSSAPAVAAAVMASTAGMGMIGSRYTAVPGR
ncbi:MAG TPA: tectonin domain-containing protein [Gammaproteobacteria bacterium]|nr:tectonin domain-containing protein [Gammaproteobacteria bacterium]